jgi:UDP-N-acetyl-D-mannosaminuronate dehydrogenase
VGNGRPLVTVLGVTFKENVPDIRNTRVIDIVRELADFGIAVQLTIRWPTVSCCGRNTACR